MSEGATVRPLRSLDWKKHELKVEDAVKIINSAVKDGLASTHTRFYDEASVFLFHWSNSDLDVEPLEAELASVFGTLFRFKISRYVIPVDLNTSKDLLFAFTRKIMEFQQQHTATNRLLIYVYSGHAEILPSNQECIIFGAVDEHAPRINWNSVRPYTEGTPGLTLYIFDTCLATSAAMHGMKGEMLASAAYGEEATRHPELSMTRRFIDLLKESGGLPSTVAQYHSQMIASMQDSGARLTSTPVHVQAPNMASITLLRLQTTPRMLMSLRDRHPTHNISRAKVLVAIHLSTYTGVPDLGEFKRYLLSNIPTNVADIEVSAAFEGGSRVYLCTLPTSVWDMLPEHPAISFVAHVRSNNLMARTSGQASLTSRPAQNENIPPQSSSSSRPPTRDILIQK